MQIIPYVGQTQISPATVTISVNPADRERVEDLVMRSCTVTTVRDERSYEAARNMVSQLKSMLTEITESAKTAKRPGNEVNDAIATLAGDISRPVTAEHNRILAIITAYVKKLEAERAKRLAEQRKAEEEAARKIAEAQRDAQRAQTEAQKIKAQLDLARAELAKQAAATAAQAENNKPLVPGGRVAHPFKYKLIDVAQVVQAGNKRLLRIELDILACQDAVRAQLEKHPDKAPSLPGIEITQETKVTIRGSGAHTST